MPENIAEPLLKWYDKNKRLLPWRDKDNAYYTWVSEIMLQQTRVEAVKPYFQRFIQELPDVAALAAAPEVPGKSAENKHSESGCSGHGRIWRQDP